MEKRFSINFVIVVAAHATLIFFILYFGHFLMSKPMVTEKVAWMSPGIMNAMGQQGMAKQATVPIPDKKPSQSQAAITQPSIPKAPPLQPAPIENTPTALPPKSEPKVPPTPQPTPEIKKTTPPKKVVPSPAVTKKPDITTQSETKGDLNIAKTQSPEKNPPSASTSVVTGETKVSTGKSSPVIKKSDKIVKKSAPGNVATTSSITQKNTDSSTANTDSNQESTGSGSASAAAIRSLESIAGNIAGSGAAKSGLTTSMTIGTYGVAGGQESDFSDYFGHIKSRMIDAWDQPKELLGVGKKFKTGIKVKITRGGAISSVSVISSSGNPLWDESALAAARKVSKVNSLPEGLGDDSGLNLTIYFEPED